MNPSMFARKCSKSSYRFGPISSRFKVLMKLSQPACHTGSGGGSCSESSDACRRRPHSLLKRTVPRAPSDESGLAAVVVLNRPFQCRHRQPAQFTDFRLDIADGKKIIFAVEIIHNKTQPFVI